MPNSERMTKRRNRILRLAKWVGAVVCALMLTAWLVSVPAFENKSLVFHFSWSEHEIELLHGHIRLERSPFPLPIFRSSVRNGLSWSQENYTSSIIYGFVLPFHGEYPASSILIVPLWLPLLLVAIPTTILWYLDFRRFPPGHCPSCNYNLTGNTSGICAECGTPLASQNKSVQSV